MIALHNYGLLHIGAAQAALIFSICPLLPPAGVTLSLAPKLLGWLWLGGALATPLLGALGLIAAGQWLPTRPTPLPDPPIIPPP